MRSTWLVAGTRMLQNAYDYLLSKLKQKTHMLDIYGKMDNIKVKLEPMVVMVCTRLICVRRRFSGVLIRASWFHKTREIP
jgi:hypothetical protein